MVPLHEAEKQIEEIVSKHLSKLQNKYQSVEYKGGTVICNSSHQDHIKLQARPDHSRRKPNFPMNSKDYQEQGGWRELQNKFERQNPEAWNIVVLKSSDGSTYEIAFSGSENSWDINTFERDFINIFLSGI